MVLAMNVREVLRLLKSDGWYRVKATGGHRQLKHPTKPGRVTVSGKVESRPASGHAQQHSEASGVRTMSGVMMRYAIVVERAERNFAAYVPDLPGCVATGSTLEEAEQLVCEAIEIHLAGMREDGLPVPKPSSVVDYVEVSA